MQMPMVAKRTATRRAQKWGSFAVLAWLASAAGAQGFPCAPLKASKSQQPAYGPAAGQPRCEGFYERNVSQPFVEIVSLTRWPPGSLTAASDGQLVLGGLPKVDTRLLIQPMRSDPFYRVDAALNRGSTFAWNSGPMLGHTRLNLRDLGFLAIAVSRGEPLLLAPVSLPGSAESTVAYAVLRPSVAVESIAWRAYRLASPPGGWRPLATAPLFAWERIALPIELPADGRGVRIDVRALDSQRQPLPLLQFVVLGVDDDAP